MLNWILWKRTVLKFNYLKKEILILNKTVWNRTAYMYKNGFGINNLQWLMGHKTKPNQTESLCFRVVLSMGQISLFKNVFFCQEHVKKKRDAPVA